MTSPSIEGHAPTRRLPPPSILDRKEAPASQPQATAAASAETSALEADLRASVRGEVRFDDGSRALYATDASNYRYPPIGVVIPQDVDDLVAAVAACRRNDAPIVHRGGGTSLTGGSCNAAVVMDVSKHLDRVLDIDIERRTARVEPGVVLDHLREQAVVHGFTFGPDPATHNRCTLGGMLGNNSCGMHAQMAGRVADNTHELDILTYDGLRLKVGPTSPDELAAIIRAGGRRGEIYAGLKTIADRYAPLIRARYPHFPRRVSGYNLDELLPENGFHVARALVGTEGTCVTILGATLRLVHAPRKRTLVTLGFDDIAAAADHVPEIIEFGPIGLEALDDKLVAYVQRAGGKRAETLRLLPKGRAFLMVEMGGETQEEADAKARLMMGAMLKRGRTKDEIRLYDRLADEEEIWAVREAGLGVTAFQKGMRDTSPGWEDASVPPERLGDYLRDYSALLKRYDLHCSVYGHFGQGCVHCRIDFDLRSEKGIANFRAFVGEAADLVVSYGGSLSGEHGDGQSRAELLPKMFGPELMQAMRAFKAVWDPRGKMNPGRVVDPEPITANLRLGADYAPKPVKTRFTWPEDGSFAHATQRCVGIGLCRRHEGGYMCPSYMVTKEEKHTTRGRAHLLFEMLQGDVVKGGWKDESVKEALDLCLACKGCKGDCPVHVDLATLKAEFLHHYYKGRLRPMAAYSMGLIYWWARLFSKMPRLVNAVAGAPVLGDLVKRAGGIAPERAIPRFAEETFRAWWARRPVQNEGAPEVILWVDTFSNNFHPDVGKAAVDVLEDAGFRVLIPKQSLCCGRPLYDYGFLGAAERLLRRDLAALRKDLRRGVPVVGLEPSCTAVFRDELPSLIPDDPDAQRLARQTMTLAEFLEKKAPHYDVPRLARRALVHPHCHHHAVLGTDADHALIGKMGLDARFTGESGCCGMAGSFGFEADKFDVSQQIGERELLPEVRKTTHDELVVSDGFSCRTQIEQATGRKAVHLAQALQLGIEAEGRLAAHRRAAVPMRRPGLAARRPELVAASVALVGLAAYLLAPRLATTTRSSP